MSIFDIFRSGNQSAPQTLQPGAVTPPVTPAPGNTGSTGPLPGTQNSPATDNNGVIPKQEGNQPTTSGQLKPEDKSPLAAFSETWKTEGTAGDESIRDLFSKFDPQKALDAAAKVDFTKVLDPSIPAKIAAGGEEGVKAFMESMNKVAQQVYGNSAVATAKIVQEALTKADGIYESRLQRDVKRLTSRDALVTANPLLNHPAVQPLVEAAQEMFIRRSPNATQSEIQQQVQDYFAALGTAFVPQTKQTSSQKTGPKEEDWSSFFGSN